MKKVPQRERMKKLLEKVLTKLEVPLSYEGVNLLIERVLDLSLQENHSIVDEPANLKNWAEIFAQDIQSWCRCQEILLLKEDEFPKICSCPNCEKKEKTKTSKKKTKNLSNLN